MTHSLDRPRPLWHMHGAGNAFVLLDGRGLEADYCALARLLCARYHTDGFLVLDTSQRADFRLLFYCPDGSRGEMCGNGSRCLCRFAFENGIAGEEMTVETDAGPVYGKRLNRECYRIRLNLPGVVDLHRKQDVAYVEIGTPGVPHSVLQLPQLHWEDAEALRPLAQALRLDPAFPKGSNVNLYTRIAEDSVRLLTYERGVEDYTLSCGTGSASVAISLWAAGKLPGKKLLVHNRGGDLFIRLETQDTDLTAVYLEGPTQQIACLDFSHIFP